MFDEYLDFDIRVGSVSHGGYSIDVNGPGGDGHALMLLPSKDPDFLALLDRLTTLDIDEAAIVGLGQILFQALFPDAIREVYARTQGVLQASQALRIKLWVASTEADVAALPWEFLHNPDSGPLALLDAPIMRYIPQPTRIPILKTQLPLRVLLTGAQTPPELDVACALEEAQQVLGSMRQHAQLTIEPHLTAQKLQHLLRTQFDVWHFIGHGGFSQDGTTGLLYFENEAGGVHPISAMQLAVSLNRCGVRLVMLNACKSGQLATNPLRSLAPALVRAHVPAVIAMQFTLPERTMRAFAEEFYQALVEGFPIDACVTEGRKAIMHVAGLDRPDWGIPIVYTRTEDGRLFDLSNNRSVPPVGGWVGALITEQLRIPEVRDALLAFRTDFEAARQQIQLINLYKQIHDRFQELEKPYSFLVRNWQGATKALSIWDELHPFITELQGSINELLNLVHSPSLKSEANLCIWLLTQGHIELEAAIENGSVAMLERAIGHLRRVLSREPSHMNTRLVENARVIRIGVLVEAMNTIRDALLRCNASLPLIRQIEERASQLEAFNDRLQKLIAVHNRWQELDDEARLFESELSHDLTNVELSASWAELRSMAEGLLVPSTADWAQALGRTITELDHMLLTSDTVKIHCLFISFRSQIIRRFGKVDAELLQACNELQQVGTTLDVLLEAMKL